MLNMNWLETHVGSLDNAVESANELYWNMTVEKSGNKWFVRAGDKGLLVTDSRETLDAFLYGFGLAYSILPEPAFAVIKEEIKKMLGADLVEEMERDRDQLK